jgi:arylamine N-acetyltransferase
VEARTTHLLHHPDKRDGARAFATLPYENLSKVIRFAEAGDAVAARELPAEIINRHLQWGTGGTCFSLTATLLHLIRSLGFEAEPILADRPYGSNTHCALRVMVEGQPHLLDPGYLTGFS